MKKTLNKLLRRNIKSNLGQFLFVVVIVFLAMSLFSGFLVNFKTLENAVDKYFSDTNLADIWVYTDKISESDEQFFADNNLKYDKRLELNVVAGIKNSNVQKNSKIFVYDKGLISTPFIYSNVAGCWIDKNVAANNNILIGQDRLVFDYHYIYNQQGELVNLTLHFDLLITGTMCLSECADTYASWPILIDKEVFLSELNRTLNSEISGVMTDITYQKITTVSYNQILVKSNDKKSDINKIIDYYSNLTDSNLLFIHGQEAVESVVLLKAEVEQSKKMIYIFPVIFLVVSILIILTTISQLILQEKTRIGTLKSLGATNKMLLNHYSKYGATLCFVGALLGFIIGPLLIPEIMFVKYDLVYSLPQEYVSLSYPWELLFMGLIIVVFMGFLTSFFACKEIVLKKPAWCLKSDIKINLKKNKKNSKVPLPIKMSFRNLKIKPFRTAMAIVGVAGCVALLLCSFGISDTLNHSLDNDLKELFLYDVSSEYKSDDFVENLADFDEIEYFETYEKYLIEVSSDNSSVSSNCFIVAEDSKFMKHKLKAGELAISKSIADDLSLKEGDLLEISINGKKESLLVSLIIETSVMNGIYTCGNLDFNKNYATLGVWIDSQGDVDSLISKLNKINGTNNAQAMTNVRASVEEKISSISLMTSTLKFFAISLAVVVLLNLISLILKERMKDIATLKVLGQGTFMVASSICLEILFISLIGMIIGMLLGFPLLILVLVVNKVKIMNFLYYISPLSFVLSMLIVISTIVVISLICVIKTKNINIIESIKSIE